MVAVLEALAQPRRRDILDLLQGGERSVGQVAEALELAQPSASKHLKVLRDAGLVEVRRDAQRRVYGLRLEPLVELDRWLEPYRHLWAARLDALQHHLDRMDDTPSTPGGSTTPSAAEITGPTTTTPRRRR